MDAATLFMILTFPTGHVDTATREHQSHKECEEAVERQHSIRDELPPGFTSDAYCVKHLRVSSVVMPRFPAAAPGSKSPIEFCYKELGITERPSTPEAFVKTMDSPVFRKCMTWAPKDTDAHVPIPSAVQLLERIPPER